MGIDGRSCSEDGESELHGEQSERAEEEPKPILGLYTRQFFGYILTARLSRARKSFWLGGGFLVIFPKSSSGSLHWRDQDFECALQ